MISYIRFIAKKNNITYCNKTSSNDLFITVLAGNGEKTPGINRGVMGLRLLEASRAWLADRLFKCHTSATGVIFFYDFFVFEAGFTAM